MENTPKRSIHRDIDYSKIVRILFSRWYLIAATVSVAFLIAYVYLWYTPKTYVTSGILKLEEKKSELSDLVNTMSSSGGSKTNLQSEKFIIQSRSLLLNAISRLDYGISFYISGRVRDYDLYPRKPLDISYSKSDSLNFFRGAITFRPVDQKTFTLSWNTAGNENKNTFSYNAPVKIENTVFTVKYDGPVNTDISYLFQFNTPEMLLERASGGLRISEAFQNTNILSLQQTDANPQFAADLLNAIMSEYLAYDQNQKTQSATKMISFIDKQQANLLTAVKGSENSLEKYKQNSGIMDINASANVALSKISEFESQRSLLNVQLIAIDQLKKQITADKDNVNLNFNLEGNVDPLLGSLVGSLNNLLRDKNLLLKTYNKSSATVEDINQQIVQVKNAALQNINASNERIRKNIGYLQEQLTKVDRQTETLPAAEKDMISLRRDFEVNEKVYSFLYEKKLEAQINRSAILPGATVIERAEVNFTPISPNPSKIYRTALIFGLLSGIGIIVLIRVLNPYVFNKESVESVTDTPIIGIIRKFPYKIDDNIQILSLTKPRSIFAESVRSIRTNLNFLAPDKESKVICITSQVSGEGKSFVAINLAGTLALIQKKVLLIGADLRRPKLHKALGGENSKGLSTYLVGQCSIEEMIQHTSYEYFDFISSGPVPPNPAELLQNERLEELLDALKKQYEFIIIDTAPVGLVSDTIPLICKSDINLFVIRYGKSKYSAATIPEGLANEYGLKNMLIVLNAFEENRLQSSFYKSSSTPGAHHYYADYNGHEKSDYYEKEKKKSWWKRK